MEELRRDYRLYVLSNTNPFVMDWARSSEFSPAGKPLDAYFDKLFLSYEMKCMKPDRAIFDRMAAEAPLVPAETLFIDDSAGQCRRRRGVGLSDLLSAQQFRLAGGGPADTRSRRLNRDGDFRFRFSAAEDRRNATEFAFALA